MGEARARCASCNKEIIETYWNVNFFLKLPSQIHQGEIIETYWNVN